jgi:hypothetical protein
LCSLLILASSSDDENEWELETSSSRKSTPRRRSTCDKDDVHSSGTLEQYSACHQSVAATRFDSISLLGHLRDREGINFAWTGYAFPEENKEIGRVYFPGFSLRNKKFVIGDIVTIKTAEVKKTVCRIVSTFQATKSFTGHYHNYEGLVEIQKRGAFALSMLLWCFDWGLL